MLKVKRDLCLFCGWLSTPLTFIVQYTFRDKAASYSTVRGRKSPCCALLSYTYTGHHVPRAPKVYSSPSIRRQVLILTRSGTAETATTLCIFSLRILAEASGWTLSISVSKRVRGEFSSNKVGPDVFLKKGAQADRKQ